MSLRWKTVMVVATTAIAVVGLLYLISEFTFMRSFHSIEDKDARKAVQQVSGALSDRIQNLNTLNHDWAAWDDTYNFVQHPDENSNYIISNPTDVTFASAELNYILIIDVNGHLVFGKAFDLIAGTQVTIVQSLNNYINSESILLQNKLDQSLSGIIVLPEGPLLVSSQPITTSEGQGPIAGTIVMAQFLDSRVIGDISGREKLPFSVATVNSANMPVDFLIASSSLSAGSAMLTIPVDSKTIAGYGLLNDIYGKPALMMKTSIPRDVYTNGVTTLRYFLLFLLIMAVLVGGLLYYILGKLVISRVGLIGNYVNGVSALSRQVRRLSIKGNDELSALGNDINKMVDSLHKSELALSAKQQAEQRLRLTIESVVEGIATTDREGKITDVNDSKVVLHGYSAKNELIGKNVLDLISGEDRSKAEQAMKKTLETGYSGIAEYQMLKKDGSKFFGERSAAILKDPQGNVTGFVISTRDVSDRKKAADELSRLNTNLLSLNAQLETKVEERTRQLEDAVDAANASNKAKSEFLASMSHELRTPLNAIIGFSQMLEEKYFGPLTEKQAEYVNDIIGSGKHLLDLINDILDLSKIEAGKMELDISKVKIEPMLQNSLIMVKEKAHAHGINLEVKTEGIETLVIMGDERKLKQVMFNLLSNAAKFTPDGGTITVEAKKEGQELVVSVSDTGIGITEEEQKKLFQAFYQASGGIKDKTPGTGLGLAITKSIIEKHCGQINIQSDGRNKGTKFVFTLPISNLLQAAAYKTQMQGV